MHALFSFIEKRLFELTKQPFTIQKIQPVSGGDINQAYYLQGQRQGYFLKYNRAEFIHFFAGEFIGLQQLKQTQTIQVPHAIDYGQYNQYSYLLMDYIPFAKITPAAERLLGRQLAQLHQIPQTFFGWHTDNTLGSTLQINTPCEDWLTFWREYRLKFQLNLSCQNGYSDKLQVLGEQLIAAMPQLFSEYKPRPSLLHGDLWGGNWAVNTQGQPVIFDPACYYGDRETDLAMTSLFGGFGAAFYAGYQEVWALDSGYQHRRDFYNLYHLLNHLNLFGGSYEHSATQIMTRLLAGLS